MIGERKMVVEINQRDLFGEKLKVAMISFVLGIVVGIIGIIALTNATSNSGNIAAGGREVYDEYSASWYWVDENNGNLRAVNKEVWLPYIDANEEPGSTEGKWVRYDEDGMMVKGWYNNENGTYYYDPITGAMAKGTVEIDGTEYEFDPVSGTLN